MRSFYQEQSVKAVDAIVLMVEVSRADIQSL